MWNTKRYQQQGKDTLFFQARNLLPNFCRIAQLPESKGGLKPRRYEQLFEPLFAFKRLALFNSRATLKTPLYSL